MEHYSVIQRNKFQSVVVRWMNLEPLTQREVSQKEKNKHCILTHIYGIQKDDTDEPSREWTCGHSEGRWGRGQTEKVALTYIHMIKHIYGLDVGHV